MEECSSFTECLSLANLRVRTKTKHDKRAAATLFERAARMRPGSKQAWLGLGACLQELEDLDGAQEALTNAMAIDPMCWRVGVNIGHCEHEHPQHPP
jgi:Flp pilus assembly protein TadD